MHRVEVDDSRMHPRTLDVRAGDSVTFVPARGGCVRQTLRVVDAESAPGTTAEVASGAVGPGVTLSHTFSSSGFFTVVSEIFSFINADVRVHHPDWTPSGSSTPLIGGTGYSTGRTSRSGLADLPPVLEVDPDRLQDPATFRRKPQGPVVAPREVLQSPGQRREAMQRSQALMESLRAKTGEDGAAEEGPAAAKRSLHAEMEASGTGAGAESAADRLRRAAGAAVAVEGEGRGKGFVHSTRQKIEEHTRQQAIRSSKRAGGERHDNVAMLPRVVADRATLTLFWGGVEAAGRNFFTEVLQSVDRGRPADLVHGLAAALVFLGRHARRRAGSGEEALPRAAFEAEEDLIYAAGGRMLDTSEPWRLAGVAMVLAVAPSLGVAVGGGYTTTPPAPVPSASSSPFPVPTSGPLACEYGALGGAIAAALEETSRALVVSAAMAATGPKAPGAAPSMREMDREGVDGAFLELWLAHAHELVGNAVVHARDVAGRAAEEARWRTAVDGPGRGKGRGGRGVPQKALRALEDAASGLRVTAARQGDLLRRGSFWGRPSKERWDEFNAEYVAWTRGLSLAQWMAVFCNPATRPFIPASSRLASGASIPGGSPFGRGRPWQKLVCGPGVPEGVAAMATFLRTDRPLLLMFVVHMGCSMLRARCVARVFFFGRLRADSASLCSPASPSPSPSPVPLPVPLPLPRPVPLSLPPLPTTAPIFKVDSTNPILPQPCPASLPPGPPEASPQREAARRAWQ